MHVDAKINEYSEKISDIFALKRDKQTDKYQ